jgi:hypothetical protein
MTVKINTEPEGQAVMYYLEGAIYIVCLIAEISGIVLLIKALKYRTEKCPRFPALNPKHYFNWKEWFTKRGHRYNWIGSSMIFFGAAIGWLTKNVIFPN